MSKKRVYLAKPGSRYSDKDAAVIGPALASLNKAGRLTRTEVVAEAEPEDSALHGYFEWDDAVAGAKFRESQAGTMIRSIVIQFPNVETPVRAFIHIKEADEDGEDAFVSSSDALKAPALVQQHLNRLRAEVRRLTREYNAWRTIAGFEEALPFLEAAEEFANAA